ncbi:MAG: hypothetical protein J7K96_12055 [Desulfobacteraceae bacterium]|nr:hypothetical protein [Desulfobacteraceae bacterium]
MKKLEEMPPESELDEIRIRNIFKVEQERVASRSVFPFPVTKCATYLKKRRMAIINGVLTENESLNSSVVTGDLTAYLPKGRAHNKNLTDFHNQDIPAYMMALQAEAILNFPFMKDVLKNYKTLPGYRIQKFFLEVIVRVAAHFFPDSVVLGHSTKPEICLAKATIASDMGCFDLYKVLGEAYPVYHAEITRRMPAYVAENMDALINAGAGKLKSPAEFFVWGKKRRFLGLHPVIEVPQKHLLGESPWVSQDQIARKVICRKILQDVKESLKINPEKPVYVIDFGGGVGNLSEILLKKIYSIPDSEDGIRELMKRKVRIIVRDASARQIKGGRRRFEKMESGLNGAGIHLRGINRNICFLENDITIAMDSADQSIIEGKTPAQVLLSKWPDMNLADSLVIGMSAYVLGAIPNEFMEKVANEICRQCTKFYVVDFSSPMWRPKAFLEDTGKWGEAYLRAVHGKTDGWMDAILHPHAKLMALSPGIASQYAAWPGVDGHNAGYTIQSDGFLKVPNIQSLAVKMQKLHKKNIYYTSKVRLFTLIYLGYAESGNIALAGVPGWMADYLIAE